MIKPSGTNRASMLPSCYSRFALLFFLCHATAATAESALALKCDDSNIIEFIVNDQVKVLRAFHAYELIKPISSLEIETAGLSEELDQYVENLRRIKNSIPSGLCSEWVSISTYNDKKCNALIKWSISADGENEILEYKTQTDVARINQRRSQEARRIEGMLRDFRAEMSPEAVSDGRTSQTEVSYFEQRLEPIFLEIRSEAEKLDRQMNAVLNEIERSITATYQAVLDDAQVSTSFVRTLERDESTGNIACEGNWHISTEFGNLEGTVRWRVYPTSDGPLVEYIQ